MAENEIHVNDEGTIFEITLYDCEILLPDLDQATFIGLEFLKPDKKSKLKKVAQFKTDGTDSIIQYTTVKGDLNQAGTWKIQAKVTLPSGKWSSTIGSFKVHANL